MKGVTRASLNVRVMLNRGRLMTILSNQELAFRSLRVLCSSRCILTLININFILIQFLRQRLSIPISPTQILYRASFLANTHVSIIPMTRTNHAQESLNSSGSYQNHMFFLQSSLGDVLASIFFIFYSLFHYQNHIQQTPCVSAKHKQEIAEDWR